MTGTTYLYRLFSANHHLLYVGIGKSALVRLGSHLTDQPWADEIAHASVERFETRGEAEAAEKAAIKQELPRYNIVHAVRAVVEKPQPSPTPAPEPVELWSFESRRSGYERTVALSLGYEVNGTPISDDYDSNDPAEYVYARWRATLEQDYVSIYWYVRSAAGGIFEAAPFQSEVSWGSFLHHYTWPRSASDGRLLNWNRLPVDDGIWTKANTNKGGFFQQVTGYKPTFAQDRLDIVAVEAAAGIMGNDVIGLKSREYQAFTQ